MSGTVAGPASIASRVRDLRSPDLLWRVYIGASLAVAVAYFFAPQGLGHHLIYDALGLSSVGMIVFAVRRYRPAVTLPWYLFAAGQLGFVFGDSIRAFYESVVGVEAPFPSAADAAYIGAYPMLAGGLFLLVRQRDKDRANVIDAMIVVTSAAVISWIYLMQPYTDDRGIPLIEVAISIAYPLMDLLLLAVAARLLVSPGARPPAYYLLGGSLIALMVADSFYTFALLNGTYHTGSFPDAGFLLSYVLWGGAALHPSMKQLSSPVSDIELKITPRRLALLASASLLAPIVWIVELARGHQLDPYTTVIPTVIAFVLVMARMSGLVRILGTALERHEEAERRRRQSEERFGSLVQHASDVITVVGADAKINFLTPSVERVLGYRRKELVEQPLSEIIHPEDVKSTLRLFGEVKKSDSREPAFAQFRWRHKDGTWRDLETAFTNLIDDVTVSGVVLNSRDVTEQTALQGQLKHQAFHDPLTDLANRALFRDRVEHALERRRAIGEQVAVLFLDVDDFKTLNDSLGHSAGDQLLRELAVRVRSCVRLGDTAARLGGDEFAILLDDTNDAQLAAARIGEALATPFEIDDKELFATVSVGISLSDPTQAGADELLRNADVAMYSAKSGGKARSVVFSPDMHLRALRRLDLEAELRRAIDRGEFRLHYQPLVDLETGHISGFEALVRWAHPERGLVGPTEFIALAEETGLIRPIGRFVLEDAARQLHSWHNRNSDLSMSVNLSSQELISKGLVEEVRHTLARSGVPPTSLVLEMTERVIMSDTEVTINRLEQLRQLGVRLSVDDFGTGFSSLSYLRNFPIDSLKIAQPFLEGVPHSEQETALVRGIIELGHNLDLQVVAEGVERPEQWDALREMRCDLVQGYLLARPQGPERIERLLEGTRFAEAGVRAARGGILSPEGMLGIGPAAA